MTNYVKPPRLSTCFFKDGKQAKKRFENILRPGAKKTGIIALLIVVVVAAGAGFLFTCDREPSHTLSEERLYKLGMASIGTDIAEPVYAADDRAIFYYRYALVVFDMREGKIEHMIDLATLDVPLSTQGEDIIFVKATADGKGVYIGSSDSSVVTQYEDEHGYWYDVDQDTVSEYTGTGDEEYFTRFGQVDTDKWTSRCVNISENKRCYFQSPSNFSGAPAAGIEFVIEENGEEMIWNPFLDESIEEELDQEELQHIRQ